jgi:hypothetical protein
MAPEEEVAEEADAWSGFDDIPGTSSPAAASLSLKNLYFFF